MIERYTRPAMKKIWSQEHRYEVWLVVEIAVVRAMEELGYVPGGTWQAIQRNARFDHGEILRIEREVHHDVIAFLTNVARSLGPEKKYLHKGMTSSDLLDTSLALLMVEALEQIRGGLEEVGWHLRRLALEHRSTVMIGRTHGVHAEPITFGFKVLNWFSEAERHASRLEAAREEIAVGKVSGAVGTFAHLEPAVEARACELLGLKPAPVSSQVVQRDRHAYVLSVLAGIGGLLERLAVEIRHLQRTEVAEAAEPFGVRQKGSSAMPHKRNPILCERLTGLARLLRAYVMPAFENMALWHERDISHSSVERVIIPDAFTALDYALWICSRVLSGLEVDAEAMRRNLESSRGLCYSQGVLLLLTERMGSREDAYEVVQAASKKAQKEDRHLLDVLLEDKRVTQVAERKEIEALFDPQRVLRNLDDVFERVLATGWAAEARGT